MLRQAFTGPAERRNRIRPPPGIERSASLDGVVGDADDTDDTDGNRAGWQATSTSTRATSERTTLTSETTGSTHLRFPCYRTDCPYPRRHDPRTIARAVERAVPPLALR
jgi:hypothetical protein